MLPGRLDAEGPIRPGGRVRPCHPEGLRQAQAFVIPRDSDRLRSRGIRQRPDRRTWRASLAATHAPGSTPVIETDATGARRFRSEVAQADQRPSRGSVVPGVEAVDVGRCLRVVLAKPAGASRSFSYAPADIKAIRSKLGKTQSEFALMIGVSVATLRNWEQGRRMPDGPALALLRVASAEPKAVTRAH